MLTTTKAVGLNTISTGSESSYPIVLIHSAALDLTYWDRQIVALSRDHAVVAIDLPGHGASPGGAHVWQRTSAGDGVLDAVSGAMEAIEADGVHLVGNSVGGAIAQAVALRHPDRIRSLTLLDTGARFNETARAAMRARAELIRAEGVEAALPGLIGHWFRPGTVTARPDLIQRVRETVLSQDPDVQAAMWEYIAKIDVADQIHAITAPTLVVVGEHDASSPLSTARALRDAIPRATLRVIANAAHLAAIEQPEAVSRLIAEHVASAA